MKKIIFFASIMSLTLIIVGMESEKSAEESTLTESKIPSVNKDQIEIDVIYKGFESLVIITEPMVRGDRPIETSIDFSGKVVTFKFKEDLSLGIYHAPFEIKLNKKSYFADLIVIGKMLQLKIGLIAPLPTSTAKIPAGPTIPVVVSFIEIGNNPEIGLAINDWSKQGIMQANFFYLAEFPQL